MFEMSLFSQVSPQRKFFDGNQNAILYFSDSSPFFWFSSDLEQAIRRNKYPLNPSDYEDLLDFKVDFKFIKEDPEECFLDGYSLIFSSPKIAAEGTLETFQSIARLNPDHFFPILDIHFLLLDRKISYLDFVRTLNLVKCNRICDL